MEDPLEDPLVVSEGAAELCAPVQQPVSPPAVSLERLSSKSVRRVLTVSYLGYALIFGLVVLASVEEEGDKRQWLIFIGVAATICAGGLYVFSLLACRCCRHPASHFSQWSAFTGLLFYLSLLVRPPGAGRERRQGITLGMVVFYLNAERRAAKPRAFLNNRIFFVSLVPWPPARRDRAQAFCSMPVYLASLLFLGALTPVREGGGWAIRRPPFGFWFYFWRVTPVVLGTGAFVAGSVLKGVRGHGVSGFAQPNRASEICDGVGALYSLLTTIYILFKLCGLPRKLEQVVYLETRTEQLVSRFVMLQEYVALIVTILYGLGITIYRAKTASSEFADAESASLMLPLVIGWAVLIQGSMFFPGDAPTFCGLAVHKTVNPVELPPWSRVVLAFRFAWDAYLDLQLGTSESAAGVIKKREKMTVVRALSGLG